MRHLDEVGAWVRGRLPELMAEHDVPAASVAIGQGDDTFTTASGVLSRATGVEATTDAIFQIGSVTKTWTATLVMQLVEESSASWRASGAAAARSRGAQARRAAARRRGPVPGLAPRHRP